MTEHGEGRGVRAGHREMVTATAIAAWSDRAVASLMELMPGCTINMDEYNEGHPDQWGTAGWTDAERTGFSL